MPEARGSDKKNGAKKGAVPAMYTFDAGDRYNGLNEPELTWKILGGTQFSPKEPDSSFAFYDAVKKGVPKLSIDSLARILNLPMTRMASLLNLSYKTLTRKKDFDLLDLSVSSHAYEIAQTVAKGLIVFEDEEKLNRWLNKPVIALHGERPLDLFDSPSGLKLVNQILIRIEEGIYS